LSVTPSLFVICRVTFTVWGLTYREISSIPLSFPFVNYGLNLYTLSMPYTGYVVYKLLFSSK
jgi:hypothetical protein